MLSQQLEVLSDAGGTLISLFASDGAGEQPANLRLLSPGEHWVVPQRWPDQKGLQKDLFFLKHFAA